MRKNISVLLAVLLLFVAACGGSDEPGADDDDAAADTAAPADDDTPTGDGGDDGASVDPADFFSSETCLDLAMAFSQAASMGMAGTGTPEDSAQALQNMADVAPDEIADDLAVLADAFGEFARVLADAGVDLQDASSFADPQVQQALEEASQAFNSDDLNAASTRVSEYISAECEGG